MQTNKHLAREARKKLWVERLNYLWQRFTALAWVVGGCTALHYSNFFGVIFQSPLVNPVFRTLALLSFAIFASLTLYSTFVLPACVEIEVAAPNILHMSAAIGFFSFLTTVVAIWPVCGWLTPVYIIVMMGGYLFLGTFLPKGKIGSCLMVVAFILASRYRATSEIS